MSTHCCDHDTPKAETIVNLARYRKILWIALTVNVTMFLVEIGAGLQAGSLSLLADAVDFAGDALNYAVSLAVLASALAWRARAALLKAASMLGFGLYVLGAAVWSVWYGGVPQATTMGGRLGPGQLAWDEVFLDGIGMNAVVDLGQGALEIPFQGSRTGFLVLEALEFLDEIEFEFGTEP